MFTLTKKPTILDSYGVLGFAFDAALGEVGSMAVTLRPPEPVGESDFKLFLDLQDAFGEELCAEYSTEEHPDDRWVFAGTIAELAYEANQHSVVVTVNDALSKMAGNLASRVFADTTVGSVLDKILPEGQPNQRTSEFVSKKVHLAIQYQESDLVFLKRLAGLYGGQLWCLQDTIWVGDPSEGEPLELELGHDVADFSIVSSLGPEKVDLKVLPYTSKSSSDKAVECPDGGFGDVQKKAIDRRKAVKLESAVHVTLDDSGRDEPDLITTRLLLSQSSGRLRIWGFARKPMYPGSHVAIKDAGGHCENLVVRALSGSWFTGSPSQFRFEASAPEGALTHEASVARDLHCSTATVEAASDDMNRVRVSFPWDKEGSVTPWLRMASPYWGQGHAHYVPPRKGDTVLVLWGQEDLDPIVLGSLALAERVGEAKETFVFKTTDGHIITIGKTDIKVANKADCGSSAVEILPKKIVISSDEIEIRAKRARINAKEKTEISSDNIETNAKTTKIKTGKLDVV